MFRSCNVMGSEVFLENLRLSEKLGARGVVFHSMFVFAGAERQLRPLLLKVSARGVFARMMVQRWL